MPEDMPDRMPDRMPEDMSDRMPEDLPVRKSINVMVGITRSKVILMLFTFFIFGRHLELEYHFVLLEPIQYEKHDFSCGRNGHFL